MKIVKENSVGKFELTKYERPFLYFQIHKDGYTVKFFVRKNFDTLKGSWDKKIFNIHDNPITIKGLYDIVLEYRREILAGVI